MRVLFAFDSLVNFKAANSYFGRMMCNQHRNVEHKCCCYSLINLVQWKDLLRVILVHLWKLLLMINTYFVLEILITNACRRSYCHSHRHWLPLSLNSTSQITKRIDSMNNQKMLLIKLFKLEKAWIWPFIDAPHWRHAQCGVVLSSTKLSL